MIRNYTNKKRGTRPDVGSISAQAQRLAALYCDHDDPACYDCAAEAQAVINSHTADVNTRERYL